MDTDWPETPSPPPPRVSRVVEIEGVQYTSCPWCEPEQLVAVGEFHETNNHGFVALPYGLGARLTLRKPI